MPRPARQRTTISQSRIWLGMDIWPLPDPTPTSTWTSWSLRISLARRSWTLKVNVVVAGVEEVVEGVEEVVDEVEEVAVVEEVVGVEEVVVELDVDVEVEVEVEVKVEVEVEVEVEEVGWSAENPSTQTQRSQGISIRPVYPKFCFSTFIILM
jgi:hypothetical protein